MKIASWNVNSIRARLERVLAWLERAEPDVLCLQELKAVEADFPAEALAGAGYRCAVYGQKTPEEALADAEKKVNGILAD